MKPISERAIAEIVCRLRKIRRDDGYLTDAGVHVFRARRSVDPSELPAVVVWDSGEQPSSATGDRISNVLTIGIEGIVVADQAETGHEVECIKADIKRALFRDKQILADAPPPDPKGQIGTITFTGATAFARDDGSSTESVQVNIAVSYVEAYGNPYGANLEQ